MADDQPLQEIEVELPAELEAGIYANFALVSSSQHDITIDFCQMAPRRGEDEQPKAKVVSRIRIAPTFVGPLLQAISSNAFNREEAIRNAQLEEGGESP